MFEKLKIIWAGMKLGKFFSQLKTKPPENDMSTKGGDFSLTNSSNNSLEQHVENNSTVIKDNSTVNETNVVINIAVTIEQVALHVNGDPRTFEVTDQAKPDLKAIEGNKSPPMKISKNNSNVKVKKDDAD